MEPIQNLTAELVCIKNGNSAECQVKSEVRSKYVIKYKPTTRGNCWLGRYRKTCHVSLDMFAIPCCHSLISVAAQVNIAIGKKMNDLCHMDR